MKRQLGLAISLISVLLMGCGNSSGPEASSSSSFVSSSGSSSNEESSSSSEVIHHFSSEWSSDKTYHWHACSDKGCNEVSDKAEHTFGDIVVTTNKETGAKIEEKTCSVCGYVQSKSHVHSFGAYEHDEDIHWKTCALCGEQSYYGSHDWSEWTVDEEPTAGKVGNRHRSCSACSFVQNKTLYYGVEYTDDGEFYNFGSYPQSKVTDVTILTSLGVYAGDSGWTAYPYYNKGLKSDYMYYKDAIYDGAMYRGVYFDHYRAYWTYLEGTAGNSMQDERGYTVNNTYWFKYEPIRWRILSLESGVAFLLSDIILDSQQYNTADSKDYPTGYDYRKYDISDIRSWLNETFYQTAFSSLDEAKILTTTVDNSLESTACESNDHTSEDTNDKVFLLSRKESIEPSYGFSRNVSTADPARVKTGSDYSFSQGLSIRTKENGSPLDNGSARWYLRSPSYDDSYGSFVSGEYGKTQSAYSQNAPACGAVPAIRITM